MMVYDITGIIKEGMWNYEAPFPKFSMKPLGNVPWVGTEVFCEIFEGLHSQTGTYLETPAHYYGNDRCYLVADIPVEKLVDVPCRIIKLDIKDFTDKEKRRRRIDADMLEKYNGNEGFPEQCAILVCTGWGRYWMDECYLNQSPYFTHDAVMWLIGKKPYILGTDFPRWDNLEKSEGFFKEFYSADILMLAPCVNLERIVKQTVTLTVLPINIPGTSSVPCRAIIKEE